MPPAQEHWDGVERHGRRPEELHAEFAHWAHPVAATYGEYRRRLSSGCEIAAVICGRNRSVEALPGVGVRPRTAPGGHAEWRLSRWMGVPCGDNEPMACHHER